MFVISLLFNNITSYDRSYNYLLLNTYIELSNVLYLILITILLCLLYICVSILQMKKLRLRSYKMCKNQCKHISPGLSNIKTHSLNHYTVYSLINKRSPTS